MSTQSTPRQTADVMAALANAGLDRFPDVSASVRPAYEPTIHPGLVAVVQAELAASVKPDATATADALSKHLGLSLKDAAPAIETLLKSAGITARAADLSPTTIASLHALVEHSARIAAHKGAKS